MQSLTYRRVSVSPTRTFAPGNAPTATAARAPPDTREGNSSSSDDGPRSCGFRLAVRNRAVAFGNWCTGMRVCWGGRCNDAKLEAVVEELRSRIKECEAKEAELEKKLVLDSRRLLALARNVNSDPFPLVLQNRIRSAMKAKAQTEARLSKCSNLITRLSREIDSIQDKEQLQAVVKTMKGVVSAARIVDLDEVDDLVEDLNDAHLDTQEATDTLLRLGEGEGESDIDTGGEACLFATGNPSGGEHMLVTRMPDAPSSTNITTHTGGAVQPASTALFND